MNDSLTKSITRAPGWDLFLALVLLCAAASEMFGLAFIIGAYSIGLALSKTKMAHQLMDDIAPINDFIVPIFFAGMGMLVDFSAMGGALSFGLVLCLLAIIGKVLGCGLPALGTGFNIKGATRIGIGMLPRGEVALIMAGVGLAGGFINPSIFGVAILMTLVTTVLAPLFLVPAFKTEESGLRKIPPIREERPKPILFSTQISQGMKRLFIPMLLDIAAQKGFNINLEEAEQGIYLLQKGKQYLSVRLEDDRLTLHTNSFQSDEVNRLVEETERQILEAVDKIYAEPDYKPAT